MTENTLYNSETEKIDEINERLSLIQLKRGLTFGTDSYFLAAFARSRKTAFASSLAAERELSRFSWRRG